jgi:glycosyltransferase involved in cell wall biosynthesis
VINPEISIIIPTFNRAHLINETLQSIIDQTYSGWECIVVDDGSTDDTEELFKDIVEKENRIKFFKRPFHKKKGANACRNIGLDNAKGNYIVLFDSDDFMTEDHLQVKVDSIKKHNVDYVITKTKNSNNQNYPPHYYNFDKVTLNSNNYILHKINWLTLDIIVKKNVISGIRFNENLQSGQEYNFFSKLVTKSNSYYFMNREVSLRRIHENSIRKKLKGKSKLYESKFIARMETYKDLINQLDDKTKAHLLILNIKIIYKFPTAVKGYRNFINHELLKLINQKFILFEIMLLFLKFKGRSYGINNRIIDYLKKVK